MTEQQPSGSGFNCGVELSHETVQLAHGGGGRRMRELIEQLLIPAFSNPALEARHDAAVLEPGSGRLALTTDAYVVKPLFFPGGDIGRLAVFGAVNDLAMAGAEPRYLTLSLILEEGLPLSDLKRVIMSAATAAREASVAVVAGDTKVVDRGQCDRLYVSTSGVGFVAPGVDVRPSRIEPDDVVLVSGDLGRHGIAVLSVREGIAFETTLESDCAPLHDVVARLIRAGIDVHCLRDLTRGGLAAALNELALDTACNIDVTEAAVPVSEPVQAACELLGLDPLYVANEGRFVAIVAERDAERTLELLRAHPIATGAARVGVVRSRPSPTPGVTLVGPLGARRRLDLLSGEQLPRIC